MTVEEIKKAVQEGRSVYWNNFGYRVICDSIGQWLVVYVTGYCWGLTNHKGDLAGEEKDYFVHESIRLGADSL